MAIFQGRARWLMLTTSVLVGLAGAGYCAPAGDREFHQPAQDLGQALRAVGRTSGLEVMFPADAVAGRMAPALEGHFAPADAIAQLLAGSGLTARFTDGAVLIRGRSPDADASAPPEAIANPQIIVTGTQIHGASPIGSKLLTIDRSTIERSGFTSTQQILQALPQNYGGGPNEGTAGATITNGANANTAFGASVNLRGLGPSSTLVLLDGHRLAPGGIGGVFGDLSMIPASAIDRVEALTDGASSLYGSDAVAGVVNIIPRKAFKGFETNLAQTSADGTANETQLSQLAGTTWNGGHAMLAVEYDRRGRLSASDRRFYTEDLTAFGGPDYRSNFGNPGTLIDANGQTYAIPAGQDGRHLTAADLVAGTRNASDDLAGTDILPRQTRVSAYASAAQEIGRVTLYAEGLFTNRRFDKRVFQPFAVPLTVTSVNPFYVDPLGTGQPVTVEYRFSKDFGQEHQSGEARAASAVGGASAELGSWHIDGHATWGRQLETTRDENAVDYVRLFAALDDPDPATAFNPFGDGSNTSPSTIASLRGSEYTRGVASMWAVSGQADGTLFELPAGAVKIAIGGEYRDERFVSRDSSNLFSDLPVSTLQPAIDRRVAAGFAELDLPIFSPAQAIAAARSLTLSASVRVEHYDDFGTTTNPKAGIRWEPVRGVTLRGSAGTSFRAPGFNDLQQGAIYQSYFTLPLADPRSSTGTTNALILVGNKPGIGPEKARTITAGIDLAPVALPGLRGSLDWFAVRYRNRIESPQSIGVAVLLNRSIYQPLIDDSPSAAEIAGYFASPSFSNEAGFSPGDVQAIVDLRNQNLAVSKESGLDFQFGYARPLLGGNADVGVDGTWLFYLRQKITKTAPSTDLLGTIDNPVDLRMRGHVEWDKGPFGASLFVNYTDGYRNTLAATPEHVSSWTTFDAQLSWDIKGAAGSGGHGMRLALSALNLFDRDPPYVNNDQGVIAFGYDPENANALGRVISVQLTTRW
jgi:iron complex outermembrane receptor protein